MFLHIDKLLWSNRWYLYQNLLFQGGDIDANDGINPLDVVVRILNNQLSSLMWIDEKVSVFAAY